MRDEVLTNIMKNRQNLSNKELSDQISEYIEKERKERQLTLLQGYLIAAEHQDEVLKIAIKDKATEELMSRLSLTKVQAQAILQLSIKRLMGLNRQSIEEEIDQISA